MQLWQEILTAAVPILVAIGGGIRWLLTWYLNRVEAHEGAMMTRFEKLQDNFLTELDERDDKEDQRRTEHLADTKVYAKSLTEFAAYLQKLPQSQRPPPEK